MDKLGHREETANSSSLNPSSFPEGNASSFPLSKVSATTPLDTYSIVLDKQREALDRRAKRKYLTVSFLKAILSRCPRSIIAHRYLHTINTCASLLINGSDGKVRTSYCKNRWCLVCGAIKTAQAVERYREPFERMISPQFLTLTSGNTVYANELEARVQQMSDANRRIIENTRKRRGLPVEGLKKFEIAPRPGNKYHPHFHFVIDGRESADAYREQWLKQFPDASFSGQHIVPATNLVELLKYVVKPFSGKDIADPRQLDFIFSFVYGKMRLTEPLGKTFRNLPGYVPTEEEFFRLSESSTALYESEDEAIFRWLQSQHDWVNTDTGEVYTGYQPNELTKARIASASDSS